MSTRLPSNNPWADIMWAAATGQGRGAPVFGPVSRGNPQGRPVPRGGQQPWSAMPNVPLPNAMPFAPTVGPVLAPLAMASAFAPQATQQQRSQTRGGFPTSFKDPLYDEVDAAAAAKHGVPLELLRSIRLDGERSNNGQVSRAGARTPYQFIPSTRQAFIKNHGIDPWRSPAEAAEAAAIHLKQDYARTGNWIAAAAGYNGGVAAANAVAQGKAPPAAETQSYIQRIAAAMGVPGGAQGAFGGQPFNPAVFNPVFGSIGQAAKDAMTTSTIDFKPPPMPEAPAAPDLPSRDFSAVDAQLAKMAPTPFSEEQKSSTRRRMLWQGAAQALASLDDDAGVGQILARVGAGMLGGRMAADEEIQARADAHDEKMRQYELMKLQNEDKKAEAAFQEATQESQLAYQRSVAMWGETMKSYREYNSVKQDGNAWLISTQLPDGTVRQQRLPIAAVTLPQFRMQQAQVQGQIAGLQANDSISDGNLVQSALISTASQIAGQEVLGQVASAGDAAVGPAYAMGLQLASAVRGGLASRLFPDNPEGKALYAQLDREAKQAAGIAVGQQMSETQQQAYTDFMVGRLGELVVAEPNGQLALEKLAPALSAVRGSNVQTQRRNKQGGVTYTETSR